MNILLLGKNGQVGHELTRSLLPLGHIKALNEKDLDLRHHNALRDVLNTEKPDVIVNAAAYTAVDKAETEKEIAWDINSTVVEILSEYAKANNALLVHYSTDYVFNGEKKGAYNENDATCPINQYGASKASGEAAIVAAGCEHLTFRTSWVFAAHGHNFIKTILKLAKEKTALTVIDDQYGAPTAAELIADMTAHSILAHKNKQLPSGLYHLTASGLTSWHGLASYILTQAETLGLSLSLKPGDVTPILSEAYAVAATRPKNSQLNTQKLSDTLGITLPDWRVYVDRMMHQLIQMRFFA